MPTKLGKKIMTKQKKIKFGPNIAKIHFDKTQIATKLKTLKLRQNLTQIMIKLKNTKCDKKIYT